MFGIGSVGRRDTMENTLVLARLFQKLLARANEKDILDANQLVEESQAATSLRRGR
jgi:DNA polymerase-3 subunit epsilon